VSAAVWLLAVATGAPSADESRNRKKNPKHAIAEVIDGEYAKDALQIRLCDSRIWERNNVATASHKSGVRADRIST